MDGWIWFSCSIFGNIERKNKEIEKMKKEKERGIVNEITFFKLSIFSLIIFSIFLFICILVNFPPLLVKETSVLLFALSLIFAVWIVQKYAED